ncbi:MAG: nucleotidyltransferase domain-containing protein [Candidatus Woesearchaeota archaeon]
MLTSCEQKIMGIVLPQPFKDYSVRQISKRIKSSYALTHESIRSLIDKDMITARKIGNSLVCKANLSADTGLLAISSLINSKKFMKTNRFSFVIDNLKNKLDNLLYVMILFGSHAKGTATKKSDIDLLFVVQNEQDIEKIKKRIKSVLSLTNEKVDFDAITTEWLIKMFEDRHSIGREVLEGSIILHGAEQYYSLVKANDKKRGH